MVDAANTKYLTSVCSSTIPWEVLIFIEEETEV
jgi:hypothetical protein